MIFQPIEFLDVTVLVTGGTLFVTGPHPTRKMTTLRLVSWVLGLGRIQVYRHYDGYPEGVIPELIKALEFAWPLPRFEADDFAAAIVRAWKDEGGGHIHIDGNPKAFEMVHGDTEYVYVIKFDKNVESHLLKYMTGMIIGLRR